MKRYVRGIGTHLVTTLIDCDISILIDEKLLKKWLKEFPPKINMTLIDVENNPVIYSCYSPKNPENYGYSGFCLLHESHVSIHCWPIEATLDIDVFSCYTFNTDKTLNLIVNFFKGDPTNTKIIFRGHGLL